MQLLFTFDEIRLLVELLEQRSEQKGADFVGEQQFIEDALDQLISRHPQFDADQLDQLAELIGNIDRDVRARLARDDQPETKAALQTKRDALGRIRDKVQEACAMA